MSDQETSGDRLKVIEAWMMKHDAEIRAWWKSQWDHNADHESRLRAIESWRYRMAGALMLASFLGAGLGVAVFTLAANR